MSANDLISRMDLYEKTAEWEAQALHMVELHMRDDDKAEWRKWSTVLAERSAFKYDVADAPAVPQEMSAREYIRAFQRMCEHIQCCPKCPLYGLVCGRFGSTISDIDKAIVIVEKWAQEHPEEVKR